MTVEIFEVMPRAEIEAKLAEIAIDIKSYGAVGDGVTDDTQAFQNAASTGLPILVPESSSFYKVSGTTILQNSIFGSGKPEIRMFGATGGRSSVTQYAGSHTIFRVNKFKGSKLEITGLSLNGQYDGRYDNTVSWAASTNYTLNAYVLSTNGSIYQCTIAGTSGTTAPSGTGSDIIDGTVHWKYIETEFDHLICVEESNNVFIHHNNLINPFGDGVSVTADPARTALSYSQNVHIYKNQMVYPRRCNVAVISGSKVFIHDNDMDKQNTYVAMLDIETDNDTTEWINDINILNNRYNTTGFFINVTNPNAGAAYVIQNIKVKGNKGKADHLIRIPSGMSGNAQNVTIEDNELYGNIGYARLALLNNVLGRLKIKDNYDYTTVGTANSPSIIISGTDSPEVINNRFESARAYAIVFYDCNNTIVRDNLAKNISYAAIYYDTNNADKTTSSSGHMIKSNRLLNVARGIVFNNKVTSGLVDQNLIDSTTAGMDYLQPNSDMIITNTNIFTGNGYGPHDNGNLKRLTSYRAYTALNGEFVFGTAPPTGAAYSYDIGSICYNMNPIEQGNAGSKYVILGWTCTNNNPLTWLPLRALTGN